MRNAPQPIRLALFLLLGLAPHAVLAAQPAATPTVLHLDFKADVQADGSLANVVPDAALSPPLQAMLRKQVAGWRYTVGSWEGKPVLQPVAQRIVVEALPVTSGGFALRIREVTFAPVVIDATRKPEGAYMAPPRYPRDAQLRGVDADLIYAMRVDAAGAAIDVELADARVPEHWVKAFDAMGREAIGKWRMRQVEVEGRPIDCRMLIPMQFRVSDGPPKPGLDTKPYRARYADICPASPVLQTMVAGTLL